VRCERLVNPKISIVLVSFLKYSFLEVSDVAVCSRLLVSDDIFRRTFFMTRLVVVNLRRSIFGWTIRHRSILTGYGVSSIPHIEKV
jgi:hypothetical protein